PRKGEGFSKGPVPEEWMRQAGHLPGKALYVAWWLWKEALLTDRAAVKFRPTDLHDEVINRWAISRGLKALEDAGLVLVSSGRRRHVLEVTLLDAPRRRCGNPFQPISGDQS